MAHNQYTPTYASTQTLIANGANILAAVAHFGLDNHRDSQRTVVTRFIAQVEWNRAQVYAGSHNSRWMSLVNTVYMLERYL